MWVPWRVFHTKFILPVSQIYTDIHASNYIRTVEHLSVLGHARAESREQASRCLVLLPGLQQQTVLHAVLAVRGKHTDGAKVQVADGNSSASSGDGDLFSARRADDHPLFVISCSCVFCVWKKR